MGSIARLKDERGRLTPEGREAIRRRVEAGETIGAVARDLGVAWATARDASNVVDGEVVEPEAATPPPPARTRPTTTTRRRRSTRRVCASPSSRRTSPTSRWSCFAFAVRSMRDGDGQEDFVVRVTMTAKITIEADTGDRAALATEELLESLRAQGVDFEVTSKSAGQAPAPAPAKTRCPRCARDDASMCRMVGHLFVAGGRDA